MGGERAGEVALKQAGDGDSAEGVVPRAKSVGLFGFAGSEECGAVRFQLEKE